MRVRLSDGRSAQFVADKVDTEDEGYSSWSRIVHGTA